MVHTVEVENQINTLLLEIRRAESAARGYLLTLGAGVPRGITRRPSPPSSPISTSWRKLTSDNPVQVENIRKLRPAVETRLDQFTREMNFVKQDQPERRRRAGARGRRRQHRRRRSARLATAMRAEEDAAVRAANRQCRPQPASWRPSVTIAGSGLVIALAGISIFLVRRSASARDEAEATVARQQPQSGDHRRRTHRRSARGQRRDPALRLYRQPRSALAAGQHHGLHQRTRGIARRHFPADRVACPRRNPGAPAPDNATDTAEPVLEGADKQLSQDFTEALGFIKSSIAKMDRLITAILNLTREGRREFEPVRIDTRELIEAIVSHRGASGRRGRGRKSASNRCPISSATASRWSRFFPT